MFSQLKTTAIETVSSTRTQDTDMTGADRTTAQDQAKDGKTHFYTDEEWAAMWNGNDEPYRASEGVRFPAAATTRSRVGSTPWAARITDYDGGNCAAPVAMLGTALNAPVEPTLVDYTGGENEEADEDWRCQLQAVSCRGTVTARDDQWLSDTDSAFLDAAASAVVAVAAGRLEVVDLIAGDRQHEEAVDAQAVAWGNQLGGASVLRVPRRLLDRATAVGGNGELVLRGAAASPAGCDALALDEDGVPLNNAHKTRVTAVQSAAGLGSAAAMLSEYQSGLAYADGAPLTLIHASDVGTVPGKSDGAFPCLGAGSVRAALADAIAHEWGCHADMAAVFVVVVPAGAFASVKAEPRSSVRVEDGAAFGARLIWAELLELQARFVTLLAKGGDDGLTADDCATGVIRRVGDTPAVGGPKSWARGANRKAAHALAEAAAAIGDYCDPYFCGSDNVRVLVVEGTGSAVSTWVVGSPATLARS